MNQQTLESLPTDLHVEGDFETREVHIEGKQLHPEASQKIRNHSPDGFNWGYGGSGPSQLALAFLLNFLPADDAQDLYMDFKFSVVASWPQADFEVILNLQDEIKKILAKK